MLEKGFEKLEEEIFRLIAEGKTLVSEPAVISSLRQKDLVEKALESAKKIYSLHRSYEKSREFIKTFVEARNGKIKNVVTYKFRVPHMFRFHRKPKVEFDVDLFVIEVS